MANNVEFLHPRSLASLHTSLQGLIRGRLWLQVLIGLFLGFGVGLLLGPDTGLISADTASLVGTWIALPGRIFLSLIQMVVIGLVVASIIRGLAASESQQQLRRLGSRLSIYYAMTTLIAIAIGLAVFAVIEPEYTMDQSVIDGITNHDTVAKENILPPQALEDLPQRIVGLLPTNPLHSMVEGQMLHIVVTAIIFGIALVQLPPEQAKPILSLMGSLQAVSMTVVRWAMYLAPVAVFGLIANLGMTTGIDALAGLGMYVLTVLLGLLSLFVVYMVILFFIGGMSPADFLGKTREVLLLAFSTSSSAAVMPLSIKTARKLGVRPSVAQFTIPMGTTINMDGTALYQMVAVMFLAASFGVDIGWQGALLVMVMVLGASIGSPGTPGVGIAILAMTLETVGIPASGIALILGVDRILDMCRTTINVTGDLVAAMVMNRWVGGPESELTEATEERQLEQQRAVTGEDVIIKN